MVKEALARGNQVVATARHLEDNAGRGLLGAVEEASDAADRAVFDTNLFGILNVQRAVLPVLRKLAEVADPPLRIQLGADVRHA
jgi:NADP-dependent 3-hydroxy acid dehydrogenase YdfG